MNAIIPETHFDFKSILSPLPCVCCGEPVHQDNLCKACYDQMKERD